MLDSEAASVHRLVDSGTVDQPRIVGASENVGFVLAARGDTLFHTTTKSRPLLMSLQFIKIYHHSSLAISRLYDHMQSRRKTHAFFVAVLVSEK